MSFLALWMEHTKLYESPTSFWKWSAYATLAGILRDNVWLQDGDSKLYLNIYVLFMAGSSQKKARPVQMSEKLAWHVNNTNIISGRASIQAVVQELNQSETNEKGQIKKGGSGIFFAPELSAGLVQDDQSIQILTDLYDNKSTPYVTNLIGRGKVRMETSPVFTMLGASNEALLKNFMDERSIYGGLLSRTFLIIPDEFRPGNAFPKGDDARFSQICQELKQVSAFHKGPLEFQKSASAFYERWYIPFRKEAATKQDKAGVLGRLPTHVKKLSAIIALAELSKNVEIRHIEQAIDECLRLLDNYRVFTHMTGKSDIAECGGLVLDSLLKNTVVSRKELIRNHWQSFSPDILDKTIAAFEAAGILQTVAAKGDIAYSLTQKGNEMLGKGLPGEFKNAIVG